MEVDTSVTGTASYDYQRFFFNTAARRIVDKDRHYGNYDFVRGLKDVGDTAPLTTKAGGLPLYIIAVHSNNIEAAQALCGWGIDPDEQFSFCQLELDNHDQSLREKVSALGNKAYDVRTYVSRYFPETQFDNILRQQQVEMDDCTAQSTKSPRKRPHQTDSSSSGRSRVRHNPGNTSHILKILTTPSEENVCGQVCEIIQHASAADIESLQAEAGNFDKTQILACCRGREYYRRMLILDSCCPMPLNSDDKERELDIINVRVEESIRYLHLPAFVYQVMTLTTHQYPLTIHSNLVSPRDVSLFPIINIRPALMALFDGQPQHKDLPPIAWLIPETFTNELSLAVKETRQMLKNSNIELDVPFAGQASEVFCQPFNLWLPRDNSGQATPTAIK